LTKSEMTLLVQRQLDFYNRRELDGFCSCYHKDIQMMNLISNQVTCRGIDEFKKIYLNLFASSPKLNCELKSRLVFDSSVIDEEFVTGAAKYPEGLHISVIYGFRDGLIDRVWFPR
jgi:hypothetical protein